MFARDAFVPLDKGLEVTWGRGATGRTKLLAFVSETVVVTVILKKNDFYVFNIESSAYQQIHLIFVITRNIIIGKRKSVYWWLNNV